MMNIKNAILLSGGVGSRLLPHTSFYNKQMLSVYNKFIIDYPLESLKRLGVKNLTIVLGGPHFSQIVSYVKDGKNFGMSVNYVYQEHPLGIAQAINLCERFVSDEEQFVTILGDNIFENPLELKNDYKSSQIILHKHPELTRFGVASLKNNSIIKIEEKPTMLNSSYDNYAITGCYIFDRQFFKFFSQIKLSSRGEYEITDIINLYKDNNDLGFSFASGMWSDAGTHESINFVNNFFYQKT